jgi:FkbM family methyltransferase
LLEFCDRLIKPGDVVFDCGANQGIYACAFAALVGPSGKVIAIEPQDYAVAALRNNIRVNGFTNVTVEHAAVSDRVGSAVLDVSHGAVSASIIRDFDRQIAMSVPTVTLAGVAERLDLKRLDAVKMDVEGAEYLALTGAKTLLDRFKPKIILEATPQETCWRKVTTLLARYGYAPHLFDSDGHVHRVADVTEEQSNVVFLA